MFRSRNLFATLSILTSGIVGRASAPVVVPGHLPVTSARTDVSTTATMSQGVAPTSTTEKKSTQFELPTNLPGSATTAVQLPKFGKDATTAERLESVQKLYPQVVPVSANNPTANEATTAVSLAELQQMALAASAKIRQAQAEVDVAYGQVVQAGLHPNPTVGYQVDQWQPSLRLPPGSTASGLGQQGGFINQLIKTAGKLKLAQQVAGYDYINALLAVRKAHVEVATQVRTAYFAALVARQNRETHAALASMADEVYQLQLKRVAAGVAAAHEPFAFHALSVQSHNAVIQAESNYRTAVKQLATAIGQRELPEAAIVGRADATPPSIDIEVMRAKLCEQHTDLLTVRNQISQAQTNTTLQRKLRIPDLQTNTYHQYDNLAQTYQFGVQLGVQLPIHDQNQGNIRSAQSRIVAASENLRATQNELQTRLTDAHMRYEASVRLAKSYRDEVLPDLARSYRGIVRQYQADPEKVGFNDIVVGQQTWSQALQTYLTAIETQWKCAVELGAIGQWDDVYPTP